MSLIETVFGSQENFEKLPVLNLGGKTKDYIDWLKPSDVSHPIQRGVDSAKRTFFTLRLKFKPLELKNGSESEQFVVTVFQRYTGEADNWAWGTMNYSPLYSGRIYEEGAKTLQELVTKGSYVKLEMAINKRDDTYSEYFLC